MYQSTWVNGVEVAKGKRDCAGRYEAIASYLRERDDLPNTLRILDFGALDGYFSQRLAEEFGANVVAIEQNRKALAHLAGHKQIRTRIAYYTPEQVRGLGHFDVVLALSVLHHQPNWRDFLAAFQEVGDIVFVEVSHPDETLPRAVAHRDAETIFETVAEAAHGSPLVETPGYDESHERPLYVIDTRTETVADTGFDAPDATATSPEPNPADELTQHDEDSGHYVDQPVPDAVVEERKETVQNFAGEVEREVETPQVESNEAPKVTAAQKRRGKAKSDGLSDSQHESSDQPE
jgi:hypothetical protein